MANKFDKFISMGNRACVDPMQFESDIAKILVAITIDPRSELDYRFVRVKANDNRYYQLQIFDKTKKHFESKNFALTNDANESLEAKMDKYYALRDICRHYRKRGIVTMPAEMFDDRMILGSSLEYVTDLIKKDDKVAIERVKHGTEVKVLQLNTFRKLANNYDQSTRGNSSLQGVLTTTLASLNFFLGKNTDNPLGNCVLSDIQDVDLRCKDIETLNKFSVFSRVFTHEMSDMFCQADSQQARESDFMCRYYRNLFDGFVFSSSVINEADLNLMSNEDNENVI